MFPIDTGYRSLNQGLLQRQSRKQLKVSPPLSLYPWICLTQLGQDTEANRLKGTKFDLLNVHHWSVLKRISILFYGIINFHFIWKCKSCFCKMINYSTLNNIITTVKKHSIYYIRYIKWNLIKTKFNYMLILHNGHQRRFVKVDVSGLHILY